MPYKDLSDKAKQVIQNRITTRKKYHRDSEGNMLPFKFILVGTGARLKGITPPKYRAQDAILPEEVRVYDPWAADGKREKSLRNILTSRERWDADKEKNVTDETLEHVELHNGICYANEHELNKLAILMFAHENTSKPEDIRMKGAKIQLVPWEERREDLFAHDFRNEVGEARLLSFALKSAFDESFERKKEILTIVSKDPKHYIYSPVNKASDSIENDFFAFVRNSPKAYLDTHVDEKTKVSVKVFDAKYRNLLVHDEAKGKYLLNDKLFFDYPKATTDNPEDALVKFLISKEGEAKRKHMESYLKPPVHPYLPREEEVVEKEPAKELVLEK